MAQKIALRYEQTDDRQVNAIQQSAKLANNAINAMPFSQGYQTPATAFTAGQTVTITHGLGRAATGFHVLNCTGGYPSFQSAIPATIDAKNQVNIQSQNACTGIFWVF